MAGSGPTLNRLRAVMRCSTNQRLYLLYYLARLYEPLSNAFNIGKTTLPCLRRLENDGTSTEYNFWKPALQSTE